MSIIDGPPGSMPELEAAFAFAAPIVNSAVAKMNLTPRQRSIFDLMKEGLCLADILQISNQQRDALLLQGIRLFQAGDLERARAVVTVLYQLKPLDTRVIYTLAVIIQTQGDVAAAAKLLIGFLALEATNPDGYLRLGECFLVAKEYEKAASTFRTALALCEGGYGLASSLEHARRMTCHVEQREPPPT